LREWQLSGTTPQFGVSTKRKIRSTSGLFYACSRAFSVHARKGDAKAVIEGGQLSAD